MRETCPTIGKECGFLEEVKSAHDQRVRNDEEEGHPVEKIFEDNYAGELRTAQAHCAPERCGLAALTDLALQKAALSKAEKTIHEMERSQGTGNI